MINDINEPHFDNIDYSIQYYDKIKENLLFYVNNFDLSIDQKISKMQKDFTARFNEQIKKLGNFSEEDKKLIVLIKTDYLKDKCKYATDYLKHASEKSLSDLNHLESKWISFQQDLVCSLSNPNRQKTADQSQRAIKLRYKRMNQECANHFQFIKQFQNFANAQITENPNLAFKAQDISLTEDQQMEELDHMLSQFLQLDPSQQNKYYFYTTPETEKMKDFLIAEATQMIIHHIKGTEKKSKKKNKKKSIKTEKKKHTIIQSSNSFQLNRLESVTDNPKITYLIELQKRTPSFRCLPRITRWKTKNPDEIRKFRDINLEGLEIFRYTYLNDEEIIQQRIRHYLPGIEQIISTAKDQIIYSFPTDRGCGLFSKLSYRDFSNYGIVYLGFDQENNLFHKYWEKIDLDTLNSADYNIYKDKDNLLTFSETEMKEDSLESWNTNGKWFFDINQQGIITINYEEGHSIQIYPIKPEMIDKNILSA